MLNNRILIIVIILFIGKNFLFASQDIPKNWPWKGITFSVSTLNGSNISKFDKIKNMNGNMVRLHINLKRDLVDNNLSVTQLIEKNFNTIDKVLDKCKEFNITSIIAFSDFPLEEASECNDKLDPRYWKNEKCLSRMNEIISMTMHRFKNRGSELTAYQLMAEPVTKVDEKGVVPDNWNRVFENIVKLRNKIDNNRYLVFTPGPWASPVGYKEMKKLNYKNIIYNIHMYAPANFTHQKIFTNRFNNWTSYPGWINLEYWNKEKLIHTLRHVKEFQDKNQDLILVGEFNAVQWANGREEYLTDLINIFDNYNWSWVFFGYVTFEGWNPDYEITNIKDKTLHYEGNSSNTWKLLKKLNNSRN